MATDKVALANLALTAIGARRISSFDEALVEAQNVKAVYPSVRDAVLMAHPWTFACKRAMLSQLVAGPAWTDDGLTVAYTKPTDFLKLNYANLPNALIRIEGAMILSDSTGLGIHYIFRNDDPTTYLPAFDIALATRLAHELCFTLTNSSAKSSALLEKYLKIDLPAAKSEDSQQGTPPEATQDEWLIARTLGTSVFPPQAPGRATWHPRD